MKCIYCEQEKSDDEMTLEHTIPQFLGGDLAPNFFKVRAVCKTCNSNLGQFVDASFARDHFISSWMTEIAFDTYDFDKKGPIPLTRMGVSDAILPGMNPDEVCECYLGAFGESILWVRPHDERMYWYVGGNPRTAKKQRTRAYFFINERSIRQNNQIIMWNTFRYAFEKYNVRKILCADTDKALPKSFGFSHRDAIDDERINFFRSTNFSSGNIKVSASFYLHFDIRFMAKLARGIGYAIFGEDIMRGTYAQEIFRGIWYNQQIDPEPEILGTSVFGLMGDNHRDFLCREGAIVISCLNVGGAIALNITIGSHKCGAIKLCDTSQLSHQATEIINNGIVVVIFKYMNKCIYMSMLDYIQHINGYKVIEDLYIIENFISVNKKRFKSL